MRAINWYILRQALATVVAATLVLTGAIWVSQSLRMISMIVNDGLSVAAFLYFTSLLLPTFFAMTLPIGATIAVMITYNRLITDSELTVMRAIGRGPWQLAYPALLSGLAVVTVGYAMSLYILPASVREFRAMQQGFSRDAAILLIQEGTFNNVAPGITVFIRGRESNGEMRGVFIHDARDPDGPITILADRGLIGTADGGPRIVLINGTRQQMDRDRSRLQILQFERNTMDIPRPQVAAATSVYRAPPERYLHELLTAGTDERDRATMPALISELHQRITGPLLGPAFILVALAALLSGEFNRRGRMGRSVTATVVIVIGQLLYMAMVNLSLRYPAAIPGQYAVVGVLMVGAIWQLNRNNLRRRRAGTVPVAPAAAGA